MKCIIASLLFALAAAAQTTQLPNTGCPSEGYPTPSGTPRVGFTFGTDYFPIGRSIDFVAIGPQASVTPVPTYYTCGQPCTQALVPQIILPGDSWSVPVPNNASLVGVCFVVQHILVSSAPPGPTCVSLTGALQVCIQP
jgi:hypothetical protein